MFYIVFLVEPKINVVIPKSWILDVEDNWEKFVNKGLNSTQKFLCFWSEAEHAQIDGKPNPNFKPQFNNVNHVFPAEGCYFGKLVHFKSECIKLCLNLFYFSIFHNIQWQ